MKIKRRFPDLNFFNENHFQKLTVKIKKMSASLHRYLKIGVRENEEKLYAYSDMHFVFDK